MATLKQFFTMAFAVTALHFTAKATDGNKISSKPVRVTVFLNGAQVTRTAQATVQPGTSTLVFSGISPDVDAQSIQVKSAGSFTILSVKQEADYLNTPPDEKRVEALEAQKKEITEKLEMQNNLYTIYQQEADMLLKNQQVGGQNSGVDLVKLRQALEFQTNRLTLIKQRQQDIKKLQQALNQQLLKFDQQIAAISAAGDNQSSNSILVTVSSKALVQANFTISYVVSKASWYPTYDVRATSTHSPVNITYKANVSQQCGEDWKDVKLTLSTGNPSISASKPELQPYYLSNSMYYSGAADRITSVYGQVLGDGKPLPAATVNVRGTSIATQTNGEGYYSLQVPSNKPVLEYKFLGFKTKEVAVTRPEINVSLEEDQSTLNELVVTAGYLDTRNKNVKTVLAGKVAGLNITEAETLPLEVTRNEHQTNVEFAIASPYTITGDGKQVLVEIKNTAIPASYTYSVVPKLNTDVFLTATITDWAKYDFLPGEASLFFEDTFIGKSLIDNRTTGDTLSLSLGVDKGIMVTRELQKELKEKKSFGSSRKESRDWLITVKNLKKEKIDLLVEDQVPVSQNGSIKVEVNDISGAQLDSDKGKLAWSFMLNSQQDKKMRVKYDVTYPKNESVIVN